MSNSALQVFSYQEQQVRTIEINNEVWFVAKDVCDVLDMTVEATRRLDDDEKGLTKIQTPGGMQEMTIINESGLYKLTFRSNKPEAKKFTKWVTSEVLPALRKTGGYSVNRISDEEIQLRLKELEARNRELDMRGAEIIQRMLDKPPFPITPETQTVFAAEVFRLSSGHDCLTMLPECADKWYTATDIGKQLGITPNKIGRIANANGIKAPEGESNEYGRWIFSKSKYSNREVPSFIYNETAFDWFKTHLFSLKGKSQ